MEYRIHKDIWIFDAEFKIKRQNILRLENAAVECVNVFDGKKILVKRMLRVGYDPTISRYLRSLVVAKNLMSLAP